MKKITYLMLGLLCLSSIGGLCSCDKGQKLTDEETVALAKQELVYAGLTSGVYKDVATYNELDGAKITYSYDVSYNTGGETNAVISFNDDFTMLYIHNVGLTGTVYTKFYAHFTCGTATADKKFNIAVKPCGEQVTVQAIATESNATSSVRNPNGASTFGMTGIIVAKEDKGFILYDGTGYIYSYGATSVAVGKTVYVDGKITWYNGIIEFSSPTVAELYGVDLDYTVPEFNPVSYNNVNRLGLYSAKPAQEKTGIAIKITGKVDIDGNYINLVFTDPAFSGYKGSIKYISDSSVGSAISKYADQDQEVTFEGYTVQTTSKDGITFINFIATKAYIA